MFYEEIDAVLGCRHIVTLRNVAEAGCSGTSASSGTSSKEEDSSEIDSKTQRKDRKLTKDKKRKRANIEVEEDEERKMLKDCFAGLKEQRSEMSDFMKNFNRVQEQQDNTMNSLVGALTNFLQNSNKN